MPKTLRRKGNGISSEYHIIVIFAGMLAASLVSGRIGNENHEKTTQIAEKNEMELGAHVPGNAPHQR